MAKKVVTDGSKPTAKKQRVIEEEKRAADEKIEFSLEFTPSEERAWIHEERCNTIVLFVCIIVAILMGVVTAFVSKAIGFNSTAAIVDTLLVFVVAGLLKKITSPFVKMYVAKNYDPSYADAAGSDMLSNRSIAGAVFMYLIMALGSCIVFISMIG